MRVRSVRGPGAFDEVADHWRALEAATEVERHTQMEEWARAACDSSGPDQVWLCAEDDHGPLAVLQGVLSRRTVGGVRARVLRNEVADGLVASRCRPDALRRDILRALARAGTPVDVVSFSRLREGSAFHQLATVRPHLVQEEARHGGFSLLDTSVPADEWFATSRNLRGALRKARNRAARAGEVRVDVAREPAEVRAAVDAYVELEVSGWKGSAGALANRPAEYLLLRDSLVAAAGSGRAAVWSLQVGGSLAAAQLSLRAGRTVVLLKVAYDEDRADLAPGKLLLERLVRECCDDPGTDRIDLVTRQEWHARWHPRPMPTFQTRDFNNRRVAGLLGRAAARVS